MFAIVRPTHFVPTAYNLFAVGIEYAPVNKRVLRKQLRDVAAFKTWRTTDYKNEALQRD